MPQSNLAHKVSLRVTQMVIGVPRGEHQRRDGDGALEHPHVHIIPESAEMASEDFSDLDRGIATRLVCKMSKRPYGEQQARPFDGIHSGRLM